MQAQYNLVLLLYVIVVHDSYSCKLLGLFPWQEACSIFSAFEQSSCLLLKLRSFLSRSGNLLASSTRFFPEVFLAFPSFENGTRLPLLKKFSPRLLAWLATTSGNKLVITSDNRFEIFAHFCTFRGCFCCKEACSKVLAFSFRVRVICLPVSVAGGLFGICCLRAICAPFPWDFHFFLISTLPFLISECLFNLCAFRDFSEIRRAGLSWDDLVLRS